MTNFSKFCPLFNTHKPSIYKAIALPISLFQPLSHLHEKTMAAFSYPSYFIRASSNTDSHDQNKQKLNNIRINGTSSMSSMKPDSLSQPAGVASTYNSFTSVNGNSITTEELRQNIPTKKRSVDPHRQGLIIEGGVGYRQTVVIRSYEVGPHKTATLESILNLLQVRIKKNLFNHPFSITHAQKYERRLYLNHFNNKINKYLNRVFYDRWYIKVSYSKW